MVARSSSTAAACSSASFCALLAASSFPYRNAYAKVGFPSRSFSRAPFRPALQRPLSPPRGARSWGHGHGLQRLDDLLHVHRAVKILHPKLAQNESIRTRFLSEARTMAALAHPNVVTVHDFGQEDKRIYIVMEWMGGGSLADLLERHGPLSPHTVIGYLLPVLDALTVAHERSIVHRDIKPDNVLLSDRGVPKLSDFGIAHVASMNRSLTRTGAAMGTWAYMAPEQRVDAKHADHRADIYAIGATLFNLITDREPLDLYATNLHAKLFAGVDDQLAALIRQATHYEPEDRYDSAEALAAALSAVMERFTDPGPLELEVAALPPPPGDQTPCRASRRPPRLPRRTQPCRRLRASPPHRRRPFCRACGVTRAPSSERALTAPRSPPVPLDRPSPWPPRPMRSRRRRPRRPSPPSCSRPRPPSPPPCPSRSQPGGRRAGPSSALRCCCSLPGASACRTS